MDGGGDRFKWGVEEHATECVFWCECDRVDDSIDVAAQAFRERRQVFFAGSVEFDDWSWFGQSFSDDGCDLHLTAEAGQNDFCSMFMRKACGRECD